MLPVEGSVVKPIKRVARLFPPRNVKKDLGKTRWAIDGPIDNPG